MTRLPVVSGRKTLAALKRAGFRVYRVTGSHYHLIPAERIFPVVTVPYHTRDLSPGTLRAIIRQANMTVEEFARYLQPDGSIWALFVDQAHEGRGIGRALFRAACAALSASGYSAATLTTQEGSCADRFYRKAGWSVTGRSAKGELVFRADL